MTKHDKDGKIVNGQAKDIKVSDDHLTYTATLRDDIKWSDGKAVTAGDFVYAWQRGVDPKTASEYANIFDPIKNATKIRNGEKKADGTAYAPSELGIVAKDDKTLEITLEAPCAYIMELFTFPTYMPVRKDIIDAKGDQWTQDPTTYVSNGCYMLKDWSHKESMTYVKNPNYYDKDSVTNDTLKFMLIEDDAAQLAAYQNNEIQFAYQFPVDEIAAWKDKPDYHTINQLGTYLVCYNTQKAPFNDPRVRKALSLAIDRNYLVEKVTKGGETPADAMVSTGVTDQDASKQFHDVGGGYYSVKPEDYEKNVAEAKKLLAEAGFPDGKGFPAFEYIFNTSSKHQSVAEALQNMWKTELGINATLSSQEWAVFVDTRNKGNFSVARHGWLADYNDPISYLTLWVTGDANNSGKYSNKDYDALIKKALSTDDNSVRMPAMHDAEKILMDDMGIAPLFFYTHPYLMNTNLKNFYESPLGFDFFMYTTVE
ncbi:peptide ABC transporter substrate-binding protein [Caproiciproducens faecalis]|uniref:Peptide ABC transporter substrate-binding protein n=1 Tax=Caproiciproducens faecalis TaxID=2820301 RepID=A0ABS7DJU9_9FIRM|nr:peptide ABC transporter substrate-binding protein [Caproiciproducens faecalis]MBW7571573.1 peptide ABC transporter substrate-binding protein [Caproiciproducens faecalis]